MHDLLRLK